ncbi:unnamed protein product [Paramecium sonneborni]|uniref:Uncharacterized protein n=1 Tax=Paramecium sonneborni TaxID=65129 RepID=A0A8S1PMG2_9CILI|nr:unnamed protein product [Paramecium sonneborni]
MQYFKQKLKAIYLDCIQYLENSKTFRLEINLDLLYHFNIQKKKRFMEGKKRDFKQCQRYSILDIFGFLTKKQNLRNLDQDVKKKSNKKIQLKKQRNILFLRCMRRNQNELIRKIQLERYLMKFYNFQ